MFYPYKYFMYKKFGKETLKNILSDNYQQKKSSFSLIFQNARIGLKISTILLEYV